MKALTTLLTAVLVAGFAPAWANAQPVSQYNSKMAVLGQLRGAHRTPTPPALSIAAVSSRLVLLQQGGPPTRVATSPSLSAADYSSRTALLGRRETVVELAPLK